MKVVILCGGNGIRLHNSNVFIPKAMVMIGHKPLIWNVMKIFANYGHTEFVLALGKNSEPIRDYFLNYNLNTCDITVKLDGGIPVMRTQHQEHNWEVTLVETGSEAGTGARLSRCKKYLSGEKFMLTYSDCLANVDIDKLIKSHYDNKKLATVTGVLPPYRYGEFLVENNKLIGYRDTSQLKSTHGWVNGGYMVFDSKIFDHLSSFNECSLEKEVFLGLVKDKQVNLFIHENFWQCLDNDREYQYLNRLCENNSEYWLFKSNQKK